MSADREHRQPGEHRQPREHEHRRPGGEPGRTAGPDRHQRLPAAPGRHPVVRPPTRRCACRPNGRGVRLRPRGSRGVRRRPAIPRGASPHRTARADPGRPPSGPGALATGSTADAVWFGAAAPLGLLAPDLRRAGAPSVGRHHPRSRGRLGQAAGCAPGAAPDRHRLRRRHLPGRVHPRPPGRCTRAARADGAAHARAWTSTTFAPDVDGAAIRRRYGLGDRPVIVCVSRLVRAQGPGHPDPCPARGPGRGPGRRAADRRPRPVPGTTWNALAERTACASTSC